MKPKMTFLLLLLLLLLVQQHLFHHYYYQTSSNLMRWKNLKKLKRIRGGDDASL
jgi:hypothetical protein